MYNEDESHRVRIKIIIRNGLAEMEKQMISIYRAARFISHTLHTAPERALNDVCVC